MKKITFPYGKQRVEYEFDESELLGVLTSSIEEYVTQFSELEIVKNALENPICSPSLCELSKGKKRVVIIASDHTRPVPSKVIMPLMLSEIRRGNPNADITILIATGCHRGTTKEELIGNFGEEIVKNEKIYIHDCDDREMLVDIGALPSGGRCEVNRLAYEADLLVAEGFIEPHLFAGFSGGRKSVLPGVCSRQTVLANHCSEFIAHERARTGSLEGNPVHIDMLWAAKTAGLKFIVNVVLNSEKKVIYAVAGDSEKAHKKGTDFLSGLCKADKIEADIAITTNGGYPLDQNVYQAAKGMTAAEVCVKKGGVVIMLSESSDGTGSEHLYEQLTSERDIDKIMQNFLSRDRNNTLFDQWQTQILVRVMQRARVIYVSNLCDEMVEKMHMIPAKNIGEAIKRAKQILGKNDAKIVCIPDGISVVVI